MLGWTREELEGRRTLDLVHPDDHQRAIESWVDMLANPGAARRVRLRHRHRDGRYLWLEVTNHNQLNNPRQMCVVAEMLNISDEMTAQEALSASELLLRRLTGALPVGVVQIDRDLRITYQNQRSVEMFGERLGTTVDAERVDDHSPTVLPALLAALRDDVDTDLEVNYLARDGELRRAMLNIRRVQVRASIGVAWARPGDVAADVLVARADAAMYQAKRQRTGRLGLVVNAAA